jgi:uncharacterized protein (UPF0147 family)
MICHNTNVPKNIRQLENTIKDNQKYKDIEHIKH